jgi:hypothetical protein
MERHPAVSFFGGFILFAGATSIQILDGLRRLDFLQKSHPTVYAAITSPPSLLVFELAGLLATMWGGWQFYRSRLETDGESRKASSSGPMPPIRPTQAINDADINGNVRMVGTVGGNYVESQTHIYYNDRGIPQRPQLSCLKVGKDGFHVYSGTFRDQFGAVAPYPFTSLRLRIENDPQRGTELSGTEAFAARLTFDSEQQNTFSVEGRWSDSQPSWLLMDRQAAELKTVNIPIGSTRILDIVLKHNSDPPCYAVTYSCGNSLFKCPEWMLQPGVHTVLLRLRCVNIDQTFELAFNNPTTGSLEPLSCKDVTPSL